MSFLKQSQLLSHGDELITERPGIFPIITLLSAVSTTCQSQQIVDERGLNVPQNYRSRFFDTSIA
jgi:hypothetical protein